MEIRFYLDPTTDLPHIYEHGVTAEEVTDFCLAMVKIYPLSAVHA